MTKPLKEIDIRFLKKMKPQNQIYQMDRYLLHWFPKPPPLSVWTKLEI